MSSTELIPHGFYTEPLPFKQRSQLTQRSILSILILLRLNVKDRIYNVIIH
uniref:Uncharacterized protein n=1 Tax=Rhizophora mucronata TaxID=61149 RepID=A0A2P2QZC7_RHIMU